MEEKGHMDDELLGRWLSGEMSPEELEAFKSSEAYDTYRHIAEFSSQLSAPSFDQNTLFEKIQANKHKTEAPIVQMRSNRRWIGIAATIIVLIGIGSLFFVNWGTSESELVAVNVGNQETKEVVLPGKSTVNLNAVSSIEYDKSSWEEERVVKLKGEGYFDVTKGKSFKVETTSGTITVLGTEFNIRERNGTMEVSCYEGKVKVTDTQNKSVKLTENMSVKIENGRIVDDWSPELEESPSWFQGESSFYEASLENVLLELENQYGVRIEHNKDFSDRLYTGAFIHGNLEEATKMVFLPMQLSYEVVNDSIIVIK
jgi:transmembrane sensor